MSATPHDRPERSEPEAYEVGQFNPTRSAVEEKHIAGCEPCSDAIQKAPDDMLVRQPHEAVNQLPQAAPAAVASAGLETVDYPSPVAEELEVPDDLARHPRYRLLKLLGHGGMGAVYLAEHSVMRRLVALKVINREYTAEPSVVERFRREIRAAAQLHHANIVGAYDAEQAGETHFLVMEYIEGVSLDQLLARQGPLPVAEACEYVRQAALGLQHAHERGMVHRDVKPHNLILRRDGPGEGAGLRAGVGRGERREQSDGDLRGRGHGGLHGSRTGRSGGAADARSDIYALGCTLYHLLAGRPPFTDSSTLLKLVAHREEAPPPVRALRPDVPEKLSAVLGGMMAKAPVDRFQTAAEVAAALEPFTDARGAYAFAITPALSKAGHALQAPKRRRRWVVAGALAALCLAVLAAIAAVIVVTVPTGSKVAVDPKGGVTVTLPGAEPAAPTVLSLIDPDGDCKVVADKGLLTIEVPGSLHDLSVEHGVMNAPRLLRDVTGDFTVQVRVGGAFQPVAPSTSWYGIPFLGAGLVLMSGDQTYIRLERATFNRDGSFYAYVNSELRTDGRAQPAFQPAVRAADQTTYLRLRRQGDRFFASFSQDGQNWDDLQALDLRAPPAVKVGVAAVSTSAEPFKANYYDFRLTGGGK